jgi:hypothetical protein
MSNVSSQQRAALAHSIESAFAAAARPADDALLGHDAPDLHCAECEEVFLAFRGKPWRDLTLELLTAFKDALPLFAPEGFRHVLPAYMLACLTDARAMDTGFASLWSLLTPPKRDPSAAREKFRQRFAPLAQSQRAAIAAYMEFACALVRDDSINPREIERSERALAFWQKFAATDERV